MVLDMATSAMPIFKVAEALLKGEALPPNVGYDAAGVPTQAPKEILVSGALMTLDRGPKSSGLALIVELLANALTGGCLPGDPDNQNWGNLAFAIDPDLLVGRESFLKNVDRTMAHIKGLKRSYPARDTHPRRPSGLPVTSRRLSGLITTVVITRLQSTPARSSPAS